MLCLAEDLIGIFVVAHSDEGAVTEVGGISPLHKCYLGDELRPLPNGIPASFPP
jgi:hypothetical protein